MNSRPIAIGREKVVTVESELTLTSRKQQRKSSGRRASTGFLDRLDIHVTGRIRLRRTLIGLS